MRLPRVELAKEGASFETLKLALDGRDGSMPDGLGTPEFSEFDPGHRRGKTLKFTGVRSRLSAPVHTRGEPSARRSLT